MTELSLVERLRRMSARYVTDDGQICGDPDDPEDVRTIAQALREAADALAEQDAAREELCGALRELLSVDHDEQVYSEELHRRANAFDRARAALAKAAPETGEAG